MNLEKIRKEILEKNNLDAILIKSKENKIYLNLPTGSGIKALITKDKNYLLFDGRYINEVNEKVDDSFDKICFNQGENYINHILDILKENSFLAIEGNDTNTLEYIKLKEKFNIHILKDELLKIRMVKSKDEIEKLKRAAKITDEIFAKVLKEIKVGISENDISSLLIYHAIKSGASSMSFDTIVTSGYRTCMPHGRPTNKKIKENEMIMIDFGITLNGYQSDMTRNICIGKPDYKMQEIFNIVREVQQKGLEYIREGIKGCDVDFFVRNLIKNYGFEKYFTHGLGHGLGIGNGELPLLNQFSEEILKENMLMSCEPGIYIPNVGGVRIEDDVLIENGKGVAITKTPKDLFIL